jgi:hypothetical protein
MENIGKMKILKLIASIALLVVVAVLLLFMMSGAGTKYIETTEQYAPESTPEFVPESVRNLPLEYVVVLDNILFDRFLNMRLLQGILQETTLIDGFPCAGGWGVQFFMSGQLRTCKLAEDIVFQDILIFQNTWIFLDEELNFSCTFPEDMEIHGYQIRNKRPVTFYQSGRLKSFFPPSNVMIQKIPCRKGKETPIFLFENGNLDRCTLSMDADIDGRRISARSAISMSEDGKVNILNDSWKRRTLLWFAGLFGY